jgi:hypothetical protein
MIAQAFVAPMSNSPSTQRLKCRTLVHSAAKYIQLRSLLPQLRNLFLQSSTLRFQPICEHRDLINNNWAMPVECAGSLFLVLLHR